MRFSQFKCDKTDTTTFKQLPNTVITKKNWLTTTTNKVISMVAILGKAIIGKLKLNKKVD